MDSILLILLSPLTQHRHDSFQGVDQHVHLFRIVIHGEGGAYSAGNTIAVHDGLSAMVASADGDAELVEERADIIGMRIADKEGEDGGLAGCGAKDADTGDLKDTLGGIAQEAILLGGDVLDAHLVHKRDGFAKSDDVAHRRGARLELERKLVVGGLFKGDVFYHLSPTLIGRQLVEDLLAAIDDADTHGTIHLVARETIEVAPQRLHIDSQMRDGLGTVDEDGDAVGMSNTDDVAYGVDGAQGIGDLVDGNDARMAIEERRQRVEVEHTLVAERDRPQAGAGQLPGDDVGVVLHTGDDHLVVATEIASGERGGHQIDAFGGPTGEDNLMTMTGMDELLHLTAHLFVLLGSKGGQMVGTAMDIAVEMAVVAVESLDNTQGFLGGGGIVEVHQLATMHLGVEDGELSPYVVIIHYHCIILFGPCTTAAFSRQRRHAPLGATESSRGYLPTVKEPTSSRAP